MYISSRRFLALGGWRKGWVTMSTYHCVNMSRWVLCWWPSSTWSSSSAESSATSLFASSSLAASASTRPWTTTSYLLPLLTSSSWFLVSLVILSVFFPPPVKKHAFSQALPGLPNELLLFWHQYPWPFGSFLCSLRSFLSERWACVPQPCLKLPNSSASYASVLTIVSFSMERYLAICRPLHPLPSSDETRCTLWKWYLESNVLRSVYLRTLTLKI